MRFEAIDAWPDGTSFPDGADAALAGTLHFPRRTTGRGAARENLRVLIADDNTVDQRVLLRILGGVGHKVHIVGDGEAALDALADRDFDVALFDVKMPKLDGIEVTKIYRMTALGAEEVPIVALTADAMEETRIRCLAAGMKACLVKPVGPARLLEIIGEIARAARTGEPVAPARPDRPVAAPTLDRDSPDERSIRPSRGSLIAAPGVLVGTALAALLIAGPAHALVINPTFDSSIAGNANAVQIEGAINTAIGTIDGLFSNSVTIPVTFTYNAAGSGNLASSSQLFYQQTYGDYVGLLTADSLANPNNTVLATALANLSHGNDANGGSSMSIAAGQLSMLTGTSLTGNATINLNSTQPFAFTKPVSNSQFDAIGSLEHELDEILGGGGAGSSMNDCITNPGFFCGTYGPTDLYRYSALNTPSFTTSSGATSYLSVDGGATNIVAFNQNSGGDFGDFAPSCGTGGGTNELIQNAFNCQGQYEDYTSLSPEFAMLEAIGWAPSNSGTPVPEPSTLALLGASLLGFAALRRWRRS